MSWVKLDDQFADHPKVAKAGPLAGWLHICGMCYAARYLTDGFIPDAMIDRLATFDNPVNNPVSNPVNNRQLAEVLTAVELWERVEGGYQIHDYLEYNPSATQVKAEREANRAKQAAWKERKAKKPIANPVSNPVNNPVSNSVNNGVPSPYPLVNVNGADAPSADPLTVCLKQLNDPATKNRVAPVATLFSARFAGGARPDYARLGKLAKELSGEHVTLAKIIWGCGIPQGDPLDYLTKAVHNSPAYTGNGNGHRPKSRDEERAAARADGFEYVDEVR